MEYMHPNMETLLDILEEMGLERYIIEKMDDGMFDESQVLDLVSDIDLYAMVPCRSQEFVEPFQSPHPQKEDDIHSVRTQCSRENDRSRS